MLIDCFDEKSVKLVSPALLVHDLCYRPTCVHVDINSIDEGGLKQHLFNVILPAGKMLI